MKNRIMSILLALALLCAILPTASLRASAATTSGTCGPNLTWSFDSATGTLTIQGSGKMDDFKYFDPAPWDELRYSIKKITIGNSVTSIGDYAFSWCTSLTSVTIPNSVTNIGNYAFSGCDSLTKITVASGNPNYCSDSHGVLFNKNKTKLIQCPRGFQGSYTIPSSVTGIGESAFSGCTALTSVTIPNSVTSIGDSAFESCASLTSVTIPNSVTSIGSYAFYYCESLTSLTIGSGVTYIGEEAFSVCTALTSVTIPDSVTSIGYSAFYGCDSLTKITVASGNPNYCSDSHGVLFNKNKTKLIQCPGRFQGSYTIPDSVTSIGDYAFSWCTSLTSVTIPNSVTNLGNYAFSGCDSLTKITVESGNPNYSSDSHGVLFNKNKTELIQCPGGYQGSYTIPSSVTGIGKSAFSGCDSLTSVTIPDSVTSIGACAFEDCTSLTSVTIPDSVTSIGDGAFSFCSEDLVIYGVAGSTAETYANEYSISFVAVAAPKITTQPSNASVALGKTATFKVVATGSNLSYQWQYKRAGETSWTNWSGKTSATLTVTAGSNNNGCKYRCVVSNPVGKRNSNYATLTVSAASVPVITTQPMAQTTTKGKTVTFKVVASGSGLSYQWQYSKDNGASWTNWSGKTAASLSVTGSATNNGCLYCCVVKNAAGSVTSSSARLTVSDVAPVVLTQPKAQTTTKGKTVTFKVVAGGSGLSYQWQYSKNNGASWTNWSGKTAASLSVTGSATNSGCLYRCVVKNSVGSVTSSSARLTVSDVAPVILTQPANASASVGKTATFKVVAAGSGLSYQWQYKKAGATSWTNWSGKTSATLTVTASSTNGGCRYRCVVKNSHGTVTSSAATLTVK